jgi:hypothetical protein
MYSDSLSKSDYKFQKFITELKKKVPDLETSELLIGKGVAVVTSLPFEAPWLNAFGACLINISDVRRGEDGKLEFQLADEDGEPYERGEAWCNADDFFDEWPK